MKKLFISVLSLLIITLSIAPTYAIEDSNLKEYIHLLDELNQTYNTNFYIYNETEYYQNSLDQIWDKTYSQYIQEILSIDTKTTKENCLNIIKMPSIINVKIDNSHSRSTQTTKTVYFNNNYNKMTLTYRYTSSGFDTSYKPSATVSKVATNNYFQMSSYTGSFKNSNKTYSVVASGKIITYYGTANKSFTVNFNI